MKMRMRSFWCGISLAIVTSLAGCGVLHQGTWSTGFDALNMVDPHRGFAHAYRNYTNMDEDFARSGTRHSIAQIGQIQIGQTRAELTRNIGTPKYRAEDDRSWDYDLHLPLDRQNRLVCQYRVYFDADGLVRGTLWRRPQCAELATGQL